ncbi:heme-degrading domain-containing protein [Burkholderia multivorans]|uniref:heme-degrading domain-containing protein n=1 Tax=Burkholderia multivorans TaxID=87883 RepID=UPI001C23E409|nr:heme-degrading domain-containing protein [Burkholderia multivorans]MBU9230038.1 heme-degrading domain-containing protein [Burkholderia multivorans]
MGMPFTHREPAPFDDDAADVTLPCFNADVACRLGEIATNLARRRGQPIAVGIVGTHAPLFYCALDGSGAADCEAIRRRQNTVLRFALSSRAVGATFRRTGQSLQSLGLSADDYALDGGGVPLRIAGARLVGALAIAGLDAERNHALAVESLRWHVGAHALAIGT